MLLLASIRDRSLAAFCLVVFASFTAVSMAILSTAFGYAILKGPLERSFQASAPILGSASLAFGGWYILAASGVVYYPF